MNFIHSEAVKRRENRSLQCLIIYVCVSAGEGAGNQREDTEDDALQDNADTSCTKRLIYNQPATQVLIFQWTTGPPCSIESHGMCMSPLGS